jgi:hypothetical protein
VERKYSKKDKCKKVIEGIRKAGLNDSLKYIKNPEVLVDIVDMLYQEFVKSKESSIIK